MKSLPALLAALICVPAWFAQSPPKPTSPKPTAGLATPALNPTQSPPPATPDPAKPDTSHQASPKAITAPIDTEIQTKIFDIQFADPERLRAIFSNRSMLIEADRDLKALTVRGTPAFLKEVEETIKRFDIPPPPPANVQLTIYLLTTAAQAPAGIALPTELNAISKDLGNPILKLADTQIIRVREGQPGQAMGVETKAEAASLSRIWLASASVGPGRKGPMVSLYGLRVWLSIPVTPPAAATSGSTSTLRADPDVSVDIDMEPNQPIMVSKVGVEKPVVVVVRATVIP